jgi:hypothetical protein
VGTQRAASQISQQVYTNRAYQPDEDTDRAFNMQE